MLSACVVALVLLADVSASVTPANYDLQRDGIAESFRDPNIHRIIANQPGGMAVTVIEFSDSSITTVPWMRIQTATDAIAFADKVSATNRSASNSTGVGQAIQAGINALDEPPCQPENMVIDISGDGESNIGMSPAGPRQRAALRGIVINGLPIIDRQRNIVEYYQEHVITPGGFVIAAHGFEDFGRAIRRKLILEISSALPSDRNTN